MNFKSKRLSIISAISTKSSLLYLLTSTTVSKRLINALSNDLNKFVVAISTILSLNPSNPFNIDDVARPISLKSFEFIRSIAIASISSNNMIIFCGCCIFFISLNSSAIFLEVCPSLLSINVSKSTIYNSLSRIRAICLAVSVLPVPGGPSNKNLFTPTLCPIALIIPKTLSLRQTGRGIDSFPISTLFRN